MLLCILLHFRYQPVKPTAAATAEVTPGSKMDEFKDQLPAEDVAKMKEKITEVRDKLADKDNMDGEQIKATVSELQQSSLKLFEMAYKKMAADKDSGSSSDSSSSDEKKEDKQ